MFDGQSVVHTVAQLKGRRLRMARALTGLSRQELYEKIGIATSTIDTWESGRVELTEKSAVRICEAFRKVGIYCTSEWLLMGTGYTPRMMGEIEKSIFASHEPSTNKEEPIPKSLLHKIPPFMDEDIKKELSFFISIHKNAIFHIVEEDFMNSRYKKKECVAGEVEDLKNLEGSVIIAQLQNGKTVLCRLLHTRGEESEVFLGKNISNKNIKISRAAEIVWHRISRKRER